MTDPIVGPKRSHHRETRPLPHGGNRSRFDWSRCGLGILRWKMAPWKYVAGSVALSLEGKEHWWYT